MRIVFYDKKELILPDIQYINDMIHSEFDSVFHAMINDSKTVGSSLINFLNTNYSNNANIELNQGCYEDAINYCVSIDPKDKRLQELTPMKRLYLYQKQPSQYRIETISKSLIIRHESIPETLNEIPNKNYFMVEMVESDDIDSIFYISLMKMVINSIYVKKCEYCGKYFLIEGRRKTVKYCDNIFKGKTQPCFALAARDKYQQSLEKDEAMMAYRKAYKKLNARVKIKKWDNSDFLTWCDKAKIELKKCKNSEITLEEFNKWLKENE
jgi:hypothetical protein